MKKTISIITLIAILFSILITGPVSASDNNVLELGEALEIAKKAFDFDSTNLDFNSNYSESTYGKKIWYLNWNSKDSKGSSMSIAVDALNKEILNMYKWENTSASYGKIPKYTREEALAKAKELAERLHPDKFKETELEEEYSLYRNYYGNDVYNFNFIRKIDGIYFRDNLIQIQVEKNTLKIRSYNLDWDTVIPIPDSKKAIDLEEARKIYEEKLGIEMAYQLIYPENSVEPKAILVYNHKSNYNIIDAITGETINKPYYNIAKDEMSAMGGSSDSGGYIPTPEEQKVIDDTSKYISKEKAMESLSKYLTLDSRYKLNYSSLYGGQKTENAAWSFSWDYSDKENNTYSYLSGTVDAVTGEIRSFSISDSINEKEFDNKKKFTEEQCKEIAEKFLAEIQPDKFKTSEYRKQYYEIYKSPENIISYNMNYIRKVNGIPAPFNSLNVTVNAYTGMVTAYNMNWHKIDFPDKEGSIKLEDAYKLIYSKHDLTLKYIRLYNYEMNNESTSIKLVYMPGDHYSMIDAKSGQFIDNSGNPVKEPLKTAFTDIEGHKYEEDIKLLVELGIIDSAESQFKPDLKIPQKEFVKLLMKATQPEYYPVAYGARYKDEYDIYYENAIAQKIMTVKDKNPEGCTTKMQASKMIINALGIGFVANLDIFNPDVKDAATISVENKGYAAIADALGIVDTSSGFFVPSWELTKAETANMLINYLKVDKNPKESETIEQILINDTQSKVMTD